MGKIFAAFVLLILGGIMFVFSKAMVRFQIWTQRTIMKAQYIPSPRTYTMMRIVGAFLLIIGILIAASLLT